jgi:hypothetical protein
MKKATTIFLLLIILVGTACVRTNKQCRENAKKAKKNKIGWRY